MRKHGSGDMRLEHGGVEDVVHSPHVSGKLEAVVELANALEDLERSEPTILCLGRLGDVVVGAVQIDERPDGEGGRRRVPDVVIVFLTGLSCNHVAFSKSDDKPLEP